jgi:hypothetical protein
MKTPEHRYLLLSLILGTLVGCASAPDRPDAAPNAPAADAPAAEEAAAARFPSTKELDALSAQDLDISGLLSATVEVEHWDMASAPPAQVGTRPQAELGPWEQPLKAAVDTRPGLALMSEGMACVAREYGKFWLTSQGSAPESLKNFWMMACGESAQGVGFSTISWDTLNPETTAEKLLESTQESLAAKGKKMMASSPHVYGAWFGREGDKAIVVFASAQRRVHMEPAAIVADAEGWVSLQGELLGGYDRLHAEINHGAYSTESCEQVKDVALPRFHLRCPMAPGDKNARIDVAGFPPGRIIGQGVLQVIARRTPEDAPTRWERPLFAIPAEVDALEKPRARLLGMLNHIRQIAGKGPLTLAEAQSETATELTPHFFAALYGKQPALIADRVALGLRAGWDIPTAVRDGEMTQAVTTRPEALGALFAEAIAAPMQRRVLMRESSQIAIGLLEAPGVLGATPRRPAGLDASPSTPSPVSGRRPTGYTLEVAVRIGVTTSVEVAVCPRGISGTCEPRLPTRPRSAVLDEPRGGGWRVAGGGRRRRLP